MFVLMSVHQPKPEYRDEVVVSMHRFGAAMEGRPGLVGVHTLQDERSDRLVGLAMFESRQAAESLLPAARAAVADDDFDTWEEVEMDGLALVPAQKLTWPSWIAGMTGSTEVRRSQPV